MHFVAVVQNEGASICLSVCLAVAVCLSITCLSILHLPVFPFVYLSVNQSLCLLMQPNFCLASSFLPLALFLPLPASYLLHFPSPSPQSLR